MSEVRKALVAGIMIGEAGATCHKAPGRTPRPVLKLGMCDEKAVRTVAEAWGVTYAPEMRAKCPRTPQNPEGRIYTTEATSERAKIIIQEYSRYLQGTELQRKWNELLKRCPGPTRIRRLRRPRPP